MKPLKRELAHSGSRFLDELDKMLFTGFMLERIHRMIERPVYNIIYLPSAEMIKNELYEVLWLRLE